MTNAMGLLSQLLDARGGVEIRRSKSGDTVVDSITIGRRDKPRPQGDILTCSTAELLMPPPPRSPWWNPARAVEWRLEQRLQAAAEHIATPRDLPLVVDPRVTEILQRTRKPKRRKAR